MKHIKMLLIGIIVLILLFILVGIFLLPDFLATITGNKSWYWVFSIHILCFSYLLGNAIRSLEEEEE